MWRSQDEADRVVPLNVSGMTADIVDADRVVCSFDVLGTDGVPRYSGDDCL